MSEAYGNLEQHHLDEGESIVWSSAQVPRFFRAKDTFPLLFGAVWFVISIMLTFYGKHMVDWLTTAPNLH